MSLAEDLENRSSSKCELCQSENSLTPYLIPPKEDDTLAGSILVCDICLKGINSADLEPKHWFCLKESMWSEHAPVQVMAYRLLSRLGSEIWAQDLKEQLYLDEETLKWAEEGLEESDVVSPTLDSNGTTLNQGDSVTLIKDLVVKGANFTAKRGTVVKNISLSDDPKFVEGRVNGTHIVLVAAYLKKA